MRALLGSTTVTATLLTLLCLMGAFYAPRVHAGDDVAIMAEIVLSLAHFPSDADKLALAAIEEGDSSASVKAVAGAIAGINHKVSDSDKATLLAIAADGNEPADLRELASIVAGINHMPGDDAKAALSVLAGK